MTTLRFVRPAAVLFLALAIPAAAKDVYKGFLDPGNPQHRATLDVLARLEKTPDDPSLHNDLGCLIARDGFWRDALREFETAAKLDKKDGRAHYNAGLVQTTRGEWGAARSAFKKAVDRAPGNWPAWWMLGFAEEKLGNPDAAVRAYASSLRVDTSLFDVRRNPYAAQTRLKSRVLLETYDRRIARAALPATEQLAQPDLLTSFQTGHVAVTAVSGPAVADDSGRTAPMPGPGGSGGGPVAAAGPGFGGAVVTSVPPVSSSRPSPPPAAPQVSAPAAPARSGGLEEAPPWFPQTSPAGPAPPKTPQPPGVEDPGAPAPAPTPRPAGPGVGCRAALPFRHEQRRSARAAACGRNELQVVPDRGDGAQEVREAAREQRLGHGVRRASLLDPVTRDVQPEPVGREVDLRPREEHRRVEALREGAQEVEGRHAGRGIDEEVRHADRGRIGERAPERVAGRLAAETLGGGDVREARREAAPLEDDRAPLRRALAVMRRPHGAARGESRVDEREGRRR